MRKKIKRYLKEIILENRSSLPSLILARFKASRYPKFDIQKNNKETELDNKNIAIIACSDNQPKKDQLKWGDYWVKQSLTREFKKLGYSVNNTKADIIIHLFGSPIKLPKHTLNIIWVYSHPDWLDPYILKQYDKIFCLSSSFIQKIKKWGFNSELMIGATNQKSPRKSQIKYDIVFVGNARPALGGRQIIKDILPTSFNLKVWGKGWQKILPPKNYGGGYIDNRQLNGLYNSAWITLSDHPQEMAREGFVDVRVFDILASGGFCISDKNPGIKEIFRDTVPQYESPQHLKQLVKFYINHPKARLALIQKGQKIALTHTWPQRAKQFLNAIKN